MAYTNQALLDKAVDITKEAARGGNTTPIDIVLEQVYKKLKELNKDTENRE